MWIPKENFSYDSALQIEDIGYLLDKNFLEHLKKYIETAKELNQQKDYCQSWIISRGTPPTIDETNNYYTKLDKAKGKCEEMDKLIDNELKKFK